MKKRFMLAAVISCVVISVLSAQQSIEGVLESLTEPYRRRRFRKLKFQSVLFLTRKPIRAVRWCRGCKAR